MPAVCALRYSCGQDIEVGGTGPVAQIERRKGGGGHGHGGGHAGGDEGSHGHDTSSDGDKSVSDKYSDHVKEVDVPGETQGRTKAYAYGPGGGKVITIPEGEPYVGRKSGGGTRAGVAGNFEYGSGIPGRSATAVGVTDVDFPYGYRPFSWQHIQAMDLSSYTQQSSRVKYMSDPPVQYGMPENATRPGGPEASANFTDAYSNTTVCILSDNSTVASLIASISANCSLSASSSKTPLPFNATSSRPCPEQAIMYYRGSSATMTLVGYNNTNLFSNNTASVMLPLPSWANTSFISCVNETTIAAIPLFGRATMPVEDSHFADADRTI
ncbi:uncharacterized protein LAESUDRAFT_737932 [Laetiporus sulphureus 93-53]|uniref:Uncharacterized protein n=1 Tax=Laetiporus sulphureus 93-53 TaxID=1314785 RepID=A0A165DBU0_9APHY|nr:uncharacterized protein LAESUDRAFT_737932 [Laetiporus sulphureus 93-53]KZT04515.1 hypothetical protein LAESUDRAFT_737932 [Laetiporus sulphureus 93-53]